jgi:DnaK suppressor protein
MTRENDIGTIRAQLQRRRRDLLQTALGHHREVQALKNQERDPEYEESAQTEAADYTLSHLMEKERRELMMIDGALTRIDEGVFGLCVDCEGEISAERLQALPFALRCEEDAEARERELRMTGAMATPSL